MNLRILKKRCKRAREVLIQHHGVRPNCFTLATGDESINTPNGMERRFDRRGWLEPGPLPGTPLYWDGPCSWGDDADCHLPTDMLADILLWQHWRPSPADIAEWDAEAARQNAELAERRTSALSSNQRHSSQPDTTGEAQ